MITSRFPLTDLESLKGGTYQHLDVEHFSAEDGAEYLKKCGIKGELANLSRLSNDYGGHALSLSLLAGYLNEYFDGQSKEACKIPFLVTTQKTKVNQILQAYSNRLSKSQISFMQLLSAFRRPINHQTLESIVYKPEFVKINPLLKPLNLLNSFDLRSLIKNLVKRGLVMREKDYTGEWCYTTHLLIREYFYNQLNTCPELRKQINLQLRDFASENLSEELPEKLEDSFPTV